jgi:hypothetical protein
MLNELKELQKWLKIPMAGVAVKTAIQAYQKKHGLKITGTPTHELWEHLAKGKKNNVIPVSHNESKKEDFSDDDAKLNEIPKEEIEIKETLPTSASILELYVLFQNTDWDRVKRAKQGLPYCFSHCTATRQTATVKAIQNGWRARGWVNDGYNVLTSANGDWTYLVAFDKVANGVAGFNSKAIHKSYIGGVNEQGKGFDNRTPEQLLFDKHWHYLIRKYCPWIEERGHNEVSNKACPSYKVKEWLKTINTTTIS